MGQALNSLRILSCRDFYVYVLNAMDIKSECCDLCRCEYHTERVDPQDDTSTISVDVGQCCAVRETH